MAVVLLIDDQPLVGDGVRRMLAGQPDLEYHYCRTPETAFDTALGLEPTVILQDLPMRAFDGLGLIRRFRAGPVTADVPLLVLSASDDARLKAEAFAAGANDYLIKFPERPEFVARVRHHSKGYEHLLQRNAAHAALARELDEAARYVRSLLPRPLRGRISTDWVFASSPALGGDSFGYHWIDDRRFAMYLLDVCGRGVGAALHSARVTQALRQGLDPAIDVRDPRAVLYALNDAFPMARHQQRYLAVWYGVFDTESRRLAYASAGHPPAVLMSAAPPAAGALLQTPNLWAGILPDAGFQGDAVTAPAGSVLYLVSDGILDVPRLSAGPDALAAFLCEVADPAADGAADVERIAACATAHAGAAGLTDDLSIVRIAFG